MVTSGLQQDLSCALGLEVGVAPGGVGHHPRGVSTGAKGQVWCGVRIWRVRGEIGGRGEVGHPGERCLGLVLRLVCGVRWLKLVGEGVALLAGCQIVKLLPKVKERTEDKAKEHFIKSAKSGTSIAHANMAIKPWTPLTPPYFAHPVSNLSLCCCREKKIHNKVLDRGWCGSALWVVTGLSNNDWQFLHLQKGGAWRTLLMHTMIIL